MVKRIVPPMSNEIITLVKDTSLARIIAMQEIIWAGEAFMKVHRAMHLAAVLHRRVTIWSSAALLTLLLRLAGAASWTISS